MDTIDSMQSGDIQKLCNPIAPIIMPESRATDNASGRLALNTDRSQFYTNENGQLCLMTPVDIVDTSMLTPGTPITINFRNMSITHGDKTFRFPTVPNITGIAPVQIKNNVIGLRLSESFVLEGGMEGEENETSSLELKYPIAITGDLPSDPRAPLTFNFQNGEISRGNVFFTPRAKMNPISIVVQRNTSIKSTASSLGVFNLNNFIYFNGFIEFSTANKIPINTECIVIKILNVTPTILYTTFAARSSNNKNYTFSISGNENYFVIKNTREIPASEQFLMSFSNIVGTV